ncbi:MAG: hypothetical protein P8I94_10605, partial [Emcibacteraceae bacterium]|nr:hypothetical protein [Emcibacteraceae bacterium]
MPLAAKSQEIVANRLVYANYLQNFSIENSLETEVYINSSEHTSTPEPVESIKSIRNYQLGVVWKDEYGRETPVFTSKESAVILDGSEAGKINTIKARIKSIAPSFATHFKYFIKETANEYYNLALDRFYLAEDGNVWLSFPSSERNKVDEETYLYLKKQHDSDIIVTNFPKYKILDIANEAPGFIAETKKAIASGDVKANEFSIPGVDVVTFEFTGPTVDSNPDFYSAFKAQNLLSIKYSSSTTKDYEIVSGGPTGDGQKFRITISEPLQESFLDSIENEDDFEIIIKEKIIERKPEFEGRFFVKINRDTDFNTNIINSFSSAEIEYGIVDSSDVPDLNLNSGAGDGTQGFGWKDSKNQVSTMKGKPQAQSKEFSLVWAGYSGGEDSPVSKGYNTHPIIDEYLQGGVGNIVRFYDTNGNKSKDYKISSVETKWGRRGITGFFGTTRTINSNARKWVEVVMDEPFESNFTPVGIEVIEQLVSSDNDLLSSKNPAVFETEPKENVELDIYY